MEENERDFVTFVGDDGNEFELDVIDYFEYQDEEYAILVDMQKLPEAGDEFEAFIMKIVVCGENGEDEEFVPVDDDKMEALSEIANERLNMISEYDCDCDCDCDCEHDDCDCEHGECDCGHEHHHHDGCGCGKHE